jgi:hypothetical protein
MERTANIQPVEWGPDRPFDRASAQASVRARAFAGVMIACALLSAALASWVPLYFSMVTVFLFAGPHNWFELRYFLMRLPARLGHSRTFFLVAFAGILVLSLTYLSLPSLYYAHLWSGDNWITMIGVWNSLVLLWIGTLIWLRGKRRPRSKWAWAFPAILALTSLNWLRPELFSVALVYLHPLVAIWFLDRHLRRTRPEWLDVYRRCLVLVPLLIAVMCWQLGPSPSLAADNGLAWRITQHAGAEILPNISSHLLVSVHIFLEMLHYLVWLVALPLIGSRGIFWDLKTIPLYRHPNGFPRMIKAVLIAGLLLVGALWSGLAVNYEATRDLYFAVAITHVLAEAPFLLRML